MALPPQGMVAVLMQVGVQLGPHPYHVNVTREALENMVAREKLPSFIKRWWVDGDRLMGEVDIAQFDIGKLLGGGA